MEDKKFKVKALYGFKDMVECIQRNVDDEFLCTKERYEFLKANNAVKLVEEKKEEKVEKEPKYFTSKKKKKFEPEEE